MRLVYLDFVQSTHLNNLAILLLVAQKNWLIMPGVLCYLLNVFVSQLNDK